MASWEDRLESLLGGLGFRVSRGSAKYRSLLGGVVVENRVVGYQRNARVVVARVKEGYRVFVVIHEADEGLAESMEVLGAKADYSSGRIDAVYYSEGLDGVERFLRRIFG